MFRHRFYWRKQNALYSLSSSIYEFISIRQFRYASGCFDMISPIALLPLTFSIFSSELSFNFFCGCMLIYSSVWLSSWIPLSISSINYLISVSLFSSFRCPCVLWCVFHILRCMLREQGYYNFSFFIWNNNFSCHCFRTLWFCCFLDLIVFLLVQFLVSCYCLFFCWFLGVAQLTHYLWFQQFYLLLLAKKLPIDCDNFDLGQISVKCCWWGMLFFISSKCPFTVRRHIHAVLVLGLLDYHGRFSYCACIFFNCSVLDVNNKS